MKTALKMIVAMAMVMVAFGMTGCATIGHGKMSVSGDRGFKAGDVITIESVAQYASDYGPYEQAIAWKVPGSEKTGVLRTHGFHFGGLNPESHGKYIVVDDSETEFNFVEAGEVCEHFTYSGDVPGPGQVIYFDSVKGKEQQGGYRREYTWWVLTSEDVRGKARTFTTVGGTFSGLEGVEDKTVMGTVKWRGILIFLKAEQK